MAELPNPNVSSSTDRNTSIPLQTVSEKYEHTAFDTFLEIFLFSVAVTGTCGNLLTLLSLFVTSALRNQLKQTSILIGALAGSDILVCSVGVPILLANLLVGYEPPFSTNAILCHTVEIFAWGTSNWSVWLMFWLAFTRWLATFWPVTWQQISSVSRKNKRNLFGAAILWSMVAFSFVAAFIEYGVGAVIHMYYVSPIPTTGECAAVPYDFTDPSSIAFFRNFVVIDAVLHCWVPLLGGLALYVTIYIRLKSGVGAKIKKKQIMPIPLASSINGATLAQATAVKRIAKKTTADAASKRGTKVKTLALVFMVHITLTFPSMTIWGLGYTIPFSHSESTAWIVKMVTVMYYASFPLNPILYGLLSRDFRSVYADTLKRIVFFWRTHNDEMLSASFNGNSTIANTMSNALPDVVRKNDFRLFREERILKQPLPPSINLELKQVGEGVAS